MTILIIGGTGLISTTISRQLLQSGHEVTLFNRGQTASRLPEGVLEIRGDRTNYAEFEATFIDRKFDVVIDMVAFGAADTESAIRAFEGRCKQFIHCSTVCVYSGPPQMIPTPETEPYHSMGWYGKNKITCEELLFGTSKARGFPATIMRPSHSYGEGGNIVRPFGPWEGLVPRLREGRPVIVPGDGQGLWASCHVDDVARGFISTMLNEKCYGQAYNIAADEYFTWNRYHEIIAEVVGSTFKPVPIPTDVLRAMAPDWSDALNEIFAWCSIFDSSKLKRDTAGTKAAYTGQTVSFREGTERLVTWLEANGKMGPFDPREDDIIAAWKLALAALPKPIPVTA